MKWLVRSVLALVTLVVVAVAVLLLIPTERVAALAADQFKAATGRTLTIDGAVKATLWPRLGVRAEGIEIANAAWSDQGPMLTAQTLEVGIALGSILGGDIQVETLEVSGAELILERNAAGQGNWEVVRPNTSSAATVSGGSRAARDISIDRAVLSGANITWRDQVSGTQVRLRAVDLETRIADLDSPLRLAGSALLNGQAVALDLSADAMRPLIDGTLTPAALALNAGETALRLEGRADLEPLSFEGRIEASSGDRFAIAQAFGVAVPELPDGLGADRIAMNAAVTLAPAGTIHLRDMLLELDRNSLTGALDIDPAGPGGRPRLVGNLASDSLDLTAFSRKGQGGESTLVAETGWGREVIDVAGLFAVDGELTFSSGPITLGDATLDEVRARATLENGRAVVTLQPLLAYGGTVTGEIVVNGRGGLSARTNLDLSGLQMLPFLTEFADFDRLVGQADLSLRLLGVGGTAQALVDSLDGSVNLKVGQGEVLGLDIPGMVRTLDLGYRGEGQKTVFDGITASFAITGGVARSDDLRLGAPYLAATGAGEIALGAQTIDYRLMPTVRREADGRGVTVPILIQGSWSDPRIRPDLEFLARQRVEAERAELEARARVEADAARARAEEAARQRLAEELDIAPEDLSSREAVEDAIRERVEQQLLGILTGQ
ncbi:AsmA family protein [Jannaschia pohangensis]|uniref:AsmA protein n=1 Tax=Jannaschia pohangensis TaxID=390807 RepID=A0A1I3M207_9RHOB|nr:AsmA family protein [Jannaschia pohangensis]SFI90957.1 AsmA protein [Jannaschia pohangensis]